MLNPFVQLKDHTRPWLGTGRKVHVRTLFVRRVAELLATRGFRNVRVGGRDITVENAAPSPFPETVVLRVLGRVRQRPGSCPPLPYFSCTGLCWTRSRCREAQYWTDKTAAELIDFIADCFADLLPTERAPTDGR